MDISGSDPVGMQYAVGVEKLRQGAAKAEGEAAVKLIAEAEAPPVGVHGEGSTINTYA
ncbi:MAG: hypothetical protein ABI467_28385 [Kofleriaceae bacterium]